MAEEAPKSADRVILPLVRKPLPLVHGRRWHGMLLGFLYVGKGIHAVTATLLLLRAPVHGELLNWAKIRCFLGFDTMSGCGMLSSFSFI